LTVLLNIDIIFKEIEKSNKNKRFIEGLTSTRITHREVAKGGTGNKPSLSN